MISTLRQIMKSNLFTKELEAKAGTSPGSLVFIGKPKEEQFALSLTRYNREKFSEHIVEDIEGLDIDGYENEVQLIEFSGTHDVSALDQLGKKLDIHPLTLEDICNSTHMSKMDEHENYLFLICKLFKYDKESRQMEIDQVSLVLKNNTVIVFSEEKSDLFMNLKKRITTPKGRIRLKSSDYLAYALVDTIVDHNMVALERFGETIESIQDKLLMSFDKKIISEIYYLREQLMFISGNLVPMREMVYNLSNYNLEIITDQTQPFLKDVYDHTTSVNSTVENYKETIRGMFDLYHTLLSSQVNDIMRVLTIIATIFIPLTFIVGVYGMNFKYMPELEWQWGYFAILGLMSAVFAVLILFFKKKKWL